MTPSSAESAPARIESLEVKNYRALRAVRLSELSPFSVLVGPNGSGKSTVFDVFAFLAEAFSVGLRKAWDKRGRFKELRTRDSEGPIEFEFKYRESAVGKPPLITYHLSVDERGGSPVVAEEWLQWRRGAYGKPFRFLSFRDGTGDVVSGEEPDEQAERVYESLSAPDVLAVSTLGQLAKHPRVTAVRKFITGWHLSYLTADHTRSVPEAGPQERLSQTGENLPNVIQYLSEQHPERLAAIFESLARRVPVVESVKAELLADGRLLLQVKDAPFSRPILAKWASDGTLKMLAYLVVLHDPVPPPLIGVEEPENHLHPRLLPELAEECRGATAQSQMLVTTHSPDFVNGLRPDEVWVLHRDRAGHTQATRVADIRGVPDFVQHGAALGQLWLEGHFRVGDPLTAGGSPVGPTTGTKAG